MPKKFEKVAIITDSMVQFGGDTRLMLDLLKIFPDVQIYTSFYDRKKYPKNFDELNIRPFADNKKIIKNIGISLSRSLSFSYPYLFETLDLSEYDLIISISAGPSKGIVTPMHTKHISIICTPPHYQFGNLRNLRGMRGENFIKKYITPIIDQNLRIWDYNAAQRPDYIISISDYIKKLVKDIYRRNSTVIYPPVDTERFKKLKPTLPRNSKDQYFLVVSRLFEYKKIDRAIHASNHLNLNLKIIGAGPDLKYLRSISGPTIEFLGELEDQKVNEYLSKCTAFIIPGTEDFGIAPVEAMAAGKPIISYNRGGALETVIQHKTGEFFGDPGVPSLVKVLKKFNPEKYKQKDCKARAKKFSSKKFTREFKKFLSTI